MRLAADEPHYQDKGGLPNFFHMANAAAKCGYAEITDDNLSDVEAALRQYAHDAEQLAMELEE